jgi:hypothetical protein
MKKLSLVLAFLVTGACALPPMFGGGGSSSSSQTATSSGESGEPGDPSHGPDDDERAAMAPRKKPTPSGETCTKNKECDTKICFVGGGDLGYCTIRCNGNSDCPLRWECGRADNAPQKICLQR